MAHWWRAYDEAVDDPKLQRLPGELFKAWFNLCCLASATGGVLPPPSDIAFKLRMSPDRLGKVMASLGQAGLLDNDETGTHPHNWDGRQFKSDVTDPTNAERQKRWRKKHRNGKDEIPTVTASVMGGVTPKRPDTDSDSEADSEKKDAAPDGARPAELVPASSEETELFRRGKAVLGKGAGGLIARLLKAKGGSIPQARAAVEQASEKHNPREYIGAVVRNKQPQGADELWDPGL